MLRSTFLSSGLFIEDSYLDVVILRGSVLSLELYAATSNAVLYSSPVTLNSTCVGCQAVVVGDTTGNGIADIVVAGESVRSAGTEVCL